MPKKRFSDQQIAFASRRADAGTTVGEICGVGAEIASGWYVARSVHH